MLERRGLPRSHDPNTTALRHYRYHVETAILNICFNSHISAIVNKALYELGNAVGKSVGVFYA